MRGWERSGRDEWYRRELPRLERTERRQRAKGRDGGEVGGY